MSGAPALQSSSSFPNLSSTGLCTKPSPAFSELSLPRVPSHSHSVLVTDSEAETDIRQVRRSDIVLDRLFGLTRTVFELLGFSLFLRRLLALSYPSHRRPHASETTHHRSKSFLKRSLLFFVWLLGCVSIGFASGVLSIVRAMFTSKLLTAAVRFGFAPALQQARDDTLSTSILQDRLEIANLAIKQLKSEGQVLQEKLKAAGERIAKLEASQADYANFFALQAKYTEVTAEIERLAKENEELKAEGLRLVKENTELRQCLAMKSPDRKDEADGFEMLARLQNQCLDSRTFDKDDETPRKKGRQNNAHDMSEDSIVIVTGVDVPKEEPSCFTGLFTPPGDSSFPASVAITPRPSSQRPQPVADAKSLTISSARHSEGASEGTSEPVNSIPIPVFTTVRPSLPPKASKLKPLLLGARFTTGGSPRRNTIKQTRRSFTLKQQENVLAGSVVTQRAPDVPHVNNDIQIRTLNPCAPAFMPRIAIEEPASVASASTETEEVTPRPMTVEPKPQSPAFSPFIFTSPSPNSPFLRPPPARRQSEEAQFPTFTKTPPTPISPTPASPLGASAVAATSTPRSTRASSVRLIRARAALRNSKRVASGSSAVLAGSLADLEVTAALGAKTTQVKARLVGKGTPPQRRALGEVTNADETSGRWPSV